MENTIFDQVAVEQIGFYPIRLIYRPGLSTQEVVDDESLIACRPECGRWQEAAANERLNLSRLPNIYFYLDSRPEMRNTQVTCKSGKCHCSNNKYSTTYIIYYLLHPNLHFLLRY